MVGGGGTGPCAVPVLSLLSALLEIISGVGCRFGLPVAFLPPHRVESTYEDIAAAVEGELPNLGTESRSVGENEQYSREIKTVDERVTGERWGELKGGARCGGADVGP